MLPEFIDYIYDFYHPITINDRAQERHYWTEMTDDERRTYRRTIAERIWAERREDIFLNLCPKCGGLARTPKAKQCRHCFHSWRG